MKAVFCDGSHKEAEGIYKFGWITDDGEEYVGELPVENFPTPYSSHCAEYLAIAAFITSHIGEEWEIRTDSNLVYYQLMGKWQVRAPALQEAYKTTKTFIDENPIKLALIKSKDNLADKILR